MGATMQKDRLDAYQRTLVDYLKIKSPVSSLFTARDIQIPGDSNTVLLPDIVVDDYITDVDHARIGADHYSGTAYTGEWKNGIPPIIWRRYSLSRHRSFGWTVFNEQQRLSPITNLSNQYLIRKLETTVIRDHDKYCMLAICQGHMTGKMVARTASDNPQPATTNAHLISCTGSAADYKWIAEPGETHDNQIQPSFAAIKGMALDKDNPMATFDQLNLMFGNNWFDSNAQNGERVLIITSALELAFINYLVDKGAGTEKAFDMFMNADVSGVDTPGYLGMLRGWQLVRIHPEFLPQVFTDQHYVVNPTANTTTPGGQTKLRQVVALAAYKTSAQIYDHFSKQRSEDGGIRFDGTDYVQEMSYDAWVIEQRSQGIVPLFLPDTAGKLKGVSDQFADVMAMVTAARAETGIPRSTYPLSGPSPLKSRPGWFQPPYTTGVMDSQLTVKEAGDLAVDAKK